jgi:hypothetical protein
MRSFGVPFSPRETETPEGLWRPTNVSHRQLRAIRPLATLCGTCHIETDRECRHYRRQFEESSGRFGPKAPARRASLCNL